MQALVAFVRNRLGLNTASTASSANTIPSGDMAIQNFHSFFAAKAGGEMVPLSLFKGKTVMVMNGASKCGLAKRNITELVELQRRIGVDALEVIVFPSDQFKQEPGTPEQIRAFYDSLGASSFHIFDLVDVNGDNAHPVYKFLREKASEVEVCTQNITLLAKLPLQIPGGGDGLITPVFKSGDKIPSVGWNFGKFLVSPTGSVIKYFHPRIFPLSFESEVKSVVQSSKLISSSL